MAKIHGGRGANYAASGLGLWFARSYCLEVPMAEKTRDEIRNEIATLREMKPRVRQFTHFGDNNHLAIETQIDVLTDWLDGVGEDEITDAAYEERDNIRDAMMEALSWATGEWDKLDYDTPSA